MTWGQARLPGSGNEDAGIFPTWRKVLARGGSPVAQWGMLSKEGTCPMLREYQVVHFTEE